MKKLALLIVTLISLSMSAQNIQTHYDLGEGRKYVTTTLEMFKPDKWGNTFFFLDLDYNMGKEKSPSLAYFEIARCLKFWQAPLSIHVEYNGGFGSFPNSTALTGTAAFPINNAYLLGIDYSINNSDFTKTFSIKALYKYIQAKQHTAQVTAVWGLHFFNRKLSFVGFADFWGEDNNQIGTKTVFISEPQLWYNFTQHLSLGGEVELSNNFGGYKGFYARPTLGAKWNF